MVGIKYIAYAAVAASTVSAAAVDDDWVLSLLKRQEPGTPRFQCHEDCGTAITLSRGADPCNDPAFNSRYQACLVCSGPANFDIWQIYGRTLTVAGTRCGLSTEPLGPSGPTPTPTTTAAPVTTTTPAAVSTTTPVTTTSEPAVDPPTNPQSTTTPPAAVSTTTSESVSVPGASTTTSASGQQASTTHAGSASASASSTATPTSGGYVAPGQSGTSSSTSTSRAVGGPTASGNPTSVRPSTTPQFTGAASAHFVSMGAFAAAVLAFLA